MKTLVFLLLVLPPSWSTPRLGQKDSDLDAELELEEGGVHSHEDPYTSAARVKTSDDVDKGYIPLCYTEPTDSKYTLECANGEFAQRWNGCIELGSQRVRCPKYHYPCNNIRPNGKEFYCSVTCKGDTFGGKRNDCIEDGQEGIESEDNAGKRLKRASPQGQTILIESLGEAAEDRGGELGYFDRTQENLNGRPVYTQRGGGHFLYHYVEDGSGSWQVGPTLGGSATGLYVYSDDLVPPTTGWKYYDGSKWRTDLTLTLTTSPPNPSSSCTTIQVAATGPAASVQSSEMGRYQWEGEWLNGHKLFRGGKDGDQYLRVATGGTTWGMHSSKDSDYSGIESGRGTTCPCQEEAGPSIRFGTDWWKYYGGGEWHVDRRIRVTCE